MAKNKFYENQEIWISDFMDPTDLEYYETLSKRKNEKSQNANFQADNISIGFKILLKRPVFSESTSFCAMIRHGRPKANDSKNIAKNRYDPPLSEKGLMQAKRTGEFLQYYFKEDGLAFDKYIIECSPFTASMMTAAQIADELGCKTV